MGVLVLNEKQETMKYWVCLEIWLSYIWIIQVYCFSFVGSEAYCAQSAGSLKE